MSRAVLEPEAPVRRGASVARFLTVNALLASSVLAMWFLLAGDAGISAIRENWRVSLTMVLGSLVGGGTSEGGGAIGFPVLTKVLSIPPAEARLFTFAVQSVGMVCASISLLVNRVPLERNALKWGVPSAMLGSVVGVLGLAPRVDGPTVRLLFTALLTGLAIALVVLHRRRSATRRSLPETAALPTWLATAGFIGGVVSGIAGVGENTVMFLVLVLALRLSEELATPATVVLMASVSVSSFLTHLFVVDDFHGRVVDMWLAAAPICAIGAPLGALICTAMSRITIARVLWVLISIELVSTVLLVPMAGGRGVLFLAAVAAATLVSVYFTNMRDPLSGPRARDEMRSSSELATLDLAPPDGGGNGEL